MPAWLESKSHILAADLVGYTLTQKVLLLPTDEPASDLPCELPEHLTAVEGAGKGAFQKKYCFVQPSRQGSL